MDGEKADLAADPIDEEADDGGGKRGDEFRRYSYTDVFEDSEPMLEDLRTVLTRDLVR